MIIGAERTYTDHFVHDVPGVDLPLELGHHTSDMRCDDIRKSRSSPVSVGYPRGELRVPDKSMTTDGHAVGLGDLDHPVSVRAREDSSGRFNALPLYGVRVTITVHGVLAPSSSSRM